MSASCCIPKFSARSYERVYLHNWLLFTHSHTSSHRFQLSALRSVFPHCLLENCLGFSVAGDSAILTALPCPHGGSSPWGFSLAVLTPRWAGGAASARAPSTGRGTVLCAGAAPHHSGLLAAPRGLAGHLLR